MTADVPTILATCAGLSPGRWSDAGYGPLLRLAIEMAGVSGRAPRVAHVNTAGGDQRVTEGQDLDAARDAGVEATHIRFFPHRNLPDLREHVLSRDVVWVSGGSLVNLLAVWRAHGLEAILREAWQAGVVLAGGSAGAICWHTGGVTGSFGPDLSPVRDGLGLVPDSLTPHIDSDPGRLPAFRRAIEAGELAAGWALPEGTGVLYRGGQAPEAVTETPGSEVLRIASAENGLQETRMPTRLVRGQPHA